MREKLKEDNSAMRERQTDRQTDTDRHKEKERETRPYQCYVTVVPSIVVHQRGSIAHPRYLVPIVPPGHDACFVVRVLP